MKLSLIFITVCAFTLASSSNSVRISVNLNDEKDELTILELSEPIEISEDKKLIDEGSQKPFSYLSDREIFNNFLKNQEIELSPTDNYEERLEIFMKNYREIREHNDRYYQGLESYQKGVNQFTHLTEDEFGSQVAGLQLSTIENLTIPSYEYQASDDEISRLPKSFNWVDRHAVFPIQDQNPCNSCYVFASIAAIEAQMIIRKGTRVKLSEQEPMECLE